MEHETVTVLIVEDSETDRELVRRVLSRDVSQSYHLIETWSWDEAIKLYQQHNPDCVLLDYSLPGFTGIDLLQNLITTQHDRHPVAAILLTGGGSEELAVKAMKAGAKDYLPKGEISAETLRLAIHNAIKKTRLESELNIKNQALEKALAEAKNASSAKGEFLANMSHEIRTPLNGVLGLINLALECEIDAAARGHLELASDSAEHLHQLINEVLDFSKIESGVLDLVSESFDVRSVISEATNVNAALLQIKKLALAVAVSDQVPQFVCGDALRWKQIIINLLSNAIKFTPENGRVEINLSTEQVTANAIDLHFSVGDTGIGIADDKRLRIFESFVQADGSTTKNYGGTGLGLSIAAKLVALMGGQISVDSVEGVGSTFHFSVQLGLADKPIVVSQDSQLNDPQVEQTPLKIVVAEDNVVNQHLIISLLKNAFHEVHLATDGVQAIELTRREKPDIVLMDMHMPRLDGLEATKRIRELELQDGSVRVPIVALTANAFNVDKDKCLAGGMDGYLSKPLRKQDLFSILKNIPSRQR